MAVYIGTSGWSYDDWYDVLYPPGTSSARRLEYYLQHFQTVELNSSYYHWPADTTFAKWRGRLPNNFLMSVKAPRELTHYQRLYRPEHWLKRIEQGLQGLNPKCGVFLVQLPPDFQRDDARLAYFLARLPRRLRTAVEFRHPSWHEETIFRLLEQNNVAYCVMSGAHLPCILRATASHVYVRLHGPKPDALYCGAYSDQDLHWWRDRICEWVSMERDVFVYFNNTMAGSAVHNAKRLKEILNC
jgi:uncharacterized protein YecE (DUF72 family)